MARLRNNHWKTMPVLGCYLLGGLMLTGLAGVAQGPSGNWPDKFTTVLNNSTPLDYPRNGRLPLYLWPAMEPGDLSQNDARLLVSALNERGIALLGAWKKREPERSLAQALTVARAQQQLNLRINVNAIDLMYSFFNGDESTAHIDEQGNKFFDDSFGSSRPMGCPFALDHRKDEIRPRFDYFVRQYARNGLEIDFIFVDWEVDGPLEVNRAYEASRKCVRCRAHLGDHVSFPEFQKTLRQMRSYLQYHAFSRPVLEVFPQALVGNYAVYPHDGYRYWYDYFEYPVAVHPHITEQQATYRTWYDEFPTTGYTMAMPVSYPWARIYHWYDFDNTDYRWFYNMLRVASNAGKSTPQAIPIVGWVHFSTVFYPQKPDPSVVPMRQDSYRELLWHMLLRGTDTFAMWCGENEYAEEVRLVQEVYAAAQQYGTFLEHGLPITFEVPAEPGTVVSGLILDDRVLVRRTDFGSSTGPVKIRAGTQVITVDHAPGQCQIIRLGTD